MDGSNILFQGETMLLGWKESHSQGAIITLLLADPGDLEAFKRMTVRKGKHAGQRLMCVMVEVGDDEQPVPQTEVRKGGALAVLSGQWCGNGRFQDWLREHSPGLWRDATHALNEEGESSVPSEVAAEVVRRVCNVENSECLLQGNLPGEDHGESGQPGTEPFQSIFGSVHGAG